MRSRIAAIPGIAFALAVLLAFPLAAGTSAASDFQTLTLFGPESFARDKSAPFYVLRTFQLPSVRGAATLHVVNGDGAGNHLVSTAVIRVNEEPVVRHWMLKKKRSRRFDIPLGHLVEGNNTLSVGVFGAPGSYLTVSITCDYALDIAIESPASGSVVYSDRATVRGTYASYDPRVAIDVNGVPAAASGGRFTAADVPLASGPNTLTATIRTPDGLADRASVNIAANLPPTAEAGRDRIVMTGTGVTLDGRDSFDPEGDIIRYRWEVLQSPGDALQAALQGTSVIENPASVTPTFNPAFPGTYIISLVVNDGHSDSPPDTVAVTAERPNVAPTANAGADQNVTVGSQVFMHGEGSFDPDGNLLTYFWEFVSVPAGSAAALDDPSSPSPSFVADAAGTYVVGLIVSDGLASSLRDTVTVLSATPNAPPVAWAGVDATVPLGSVIRLDGTESFDPENDPLTYDWRVVSVPPGSAATLDDPSSPTPSFTADAVGDFVFRLVVNDGTHGSAPDTVVVTAAPPPPNGAPTADAGPDTLAIFGSPFSLDGSRSADPDGDPLTYRWSLAGAPFGSTAVLGDPSSSHPVFTPDLLGFYEFTLVVNDGTSDSAPDSVFVSVVPPATVPVCVGVSLSIARTRILGAGLGVGNITYASSSTVPAGRIISQDPPAGTIVPEGSPVDLVVSSGL